MEGIGIYGGEGDKGKKRGQRAQNFRDVIIRVRLRFREVDTRGIVTKKARPREEVFANGGEKKVRIYRLHLERICLGVKKV